MPTANPFSIVVIPDTQMVTKFSPGLLTTMAEWIVGQAETLNIQAVLHVGDVVHEGAADEIQFQHAKQAFDLIAAHHIPLLIAIGNHDYDNLVETDRKADMFNRYFGVDHYRNKRWFGGVFEAGRAENLYAKLEVEGRKLLFLVLEFGPRDGVLAWADEVLQSHPDHEAIVITHSYMYMFGERTKSGDEHNPKLYAGAVGANDGEDMWHKSFKRHPNLSAVFSGHHITDRVSYRMDSGDHGNGVFQSFQNWQCADNGGECRMRIMQYDVTANSVILRVANPLTGSYEEDPGYRVRYPITLSSRHTESDAIRYPK